MSPGYHTIKYAERCAAKRERQAEESAKPSAKRRRLVLSSERATTQGATEALEGETYESGIYKSKKNTKYTELRMYIAIPRAA